MSDTTEAFARVKIDALLQDAGWNLTDGSSDPGPADGDDLAQDAQSIVGADPPGAKSRIFGPGARYAHHG